MLGRGFSFEAYVKNLKRQLNAPVKLPRFYWMLMDMFLPKFAIYQGMVALNCFMSHINSWCPDFFQKKVLSDAGVKLTLSDMTSFLSDNMSGIKKYIFRPEYPFSR